MTLKGWLAVIAIVAPFPAVSDDGFFFLLSRDTFICLRDSAGLYEPSEGEVVFIQTQACGKREAASTDMSALVQNSAPDLVLSVEDGPDEIVALASEDFGLGARICQP